MIRIEKWIKRKFHKAIFFIEKLRELTIPVTNRELFEEKYESLKDRFTNWAVKRPWREECQLLDFQSDRGTSTPFSHYSSFETVKSLRSLAKKCAIEDLKGMDYRRDEDRSYATKSKSCFSKSLSILERAKRIFTEPEEESRFSRQKDINEVDLLVRRASTGKDVALV